MTKQYLDELLTSNDPDKIRTAFSVNEIQAEKSMYDIKNHPVLDTAIRKDKIINDDNGQPTKTVEVNRLPLSIQKKIVSLAASFLGVPALKSTPQNDKGKAMLETVKRILDDNKFEYRFREVVTLTKSEKQAAIILFTEDAPDGYYSGVEFKSKFRVRMRVVSGSKGDKLYPVYDEYGDMIAFGRYYSIKTEENKEIEALEVYTAEKIIFYRKDPEWNEVVREGAVEGGIKNTFGKIPVIYFRQNQYEWEDVERLICRLETKMSNHADSNDYVENPIVLAAGDVKGFAAKGEQGKVLELGTDAKVEYLKYDSLPESMKLEIENLKEYIGSLSQTPDTSFQAVKGLGDLSGVAIKLLFMDAHLKASNSEEIFGEGVQRLINYLKTVISVLDTSFAAEKGLSITPKFTYFLPQNDKEMIDMINTAVQGGFMSIETAVSLNPLVEDADTELVRIKAQTVKQQIQPNAGN